MTELSILQHIWYAVIAIAVAMYTILDGFDLGVGILHLFIKGDRNRRIFLNAIGPVWDGNEVWLVIVGGALFAGFPPAYSVFCTALYTPIMMLLLGLILRAVAIEFRSKVEHARWRNIWDRIFGISSLVISLLIGVALANLARGIPIGENGEFFGTFFDFLSPYALLVGLTSVALFCMHGCIYLLMKTEGDLHEKLRSWVLPTVASFVIMYFLTTMATLIYLPHMTDIMRVQPLSFVVPLLGLLSVSSIVYFVQKDYDGYAFISSCFSIFLLLAVFALGLYPNIIRSSIDPSLYSITLSNASASVYTLWVVLIVAILGIPAVLGYGYWIYKVFRGKVRLDHASY